MNTRHIILTILLIAPAACASLPAGQADASKTPNSINYTCSDGQVVRAAYPDSRTALVIIKGEAHTLHVVISGSGARYIGDDWQWWTKGMHDGQLAPLAAGETIASAPGLACHAH